MTKSSVLTSFLELSELAEKMAYALADQVQESSTLITDALQTGGKVLVCGNGGSAADAQHFVAELVGRMAIERHALPAVSLSSDPSVVTALSNDYGYDQLFARQVSALGHERDVLLMISTSGHSANVIEALKIAQAAGLHTIALLGQGGDPLLDTCDVTFHVPTTNTQRVQEIHSAVLHAICEQVEQAVSQPK